VICALEDEGNRISARYAKERRRKMKNIKNRLLVLVVVLAPLLVLQPSPSVAQQPGGTRVLQGTLAGAPYRILVPSNWNGTLLVFAHGYRVRANDPDDVDYRFADAAPTTVDGSPQDMENLLLSQGYALAASAFKNNGWAVKEGWIDSLVLTVFAQRKLGRPKHTIMWGESMGSLIGLKLAEMPARLYDGVICDCSPGAGATANWDFGLALALGYSAGLGWPATWGTVGNVPTSLDFESDVAPVLLGQLTNAADFGDFEFMRLVGQLPSTQFYNGRTFLAEDAFFVTEARAELEQRAGGPFVQNLNQVYTLTSDEMAYLGSLGVDAASLLAAMNSMRNISAQPSAREYVHHWFDPTGAIHRPVLTIHTTVDGFVIPANESVYQQLVQAAGHSDRLVQVYADAVGHCAFTQQQLLTTVHAMESWVDTGQKPSPDAFPGSQGFDPTYVPPAWPQPLSAGGSRASRLSGRR
jgi:pimeloyl-ACP methyl ester carboxylesterase